MAITNPVTIGFKIIIGLFHAAPGKSYLTDIENLAKGKTLEQLADALAATTIFTSGIMGGKDTTALKVAVLMHNFGVVADSNPGSVGSQAQAFFTDRIESGVGLGAIVYEAVNFLSQDSATLPAAFTTVAILLSNKAAVAAAFSATNLSTDLAKLQIVLSAVTGTELYTDVQVATILAASGFIVSTGNGNDTITSGVGNDSINGGAGNDTIAAQAGADIITGGSGNDSIALGVDSDMDTVIFGATAGDNGNDIITNFISGTDKLNVGALTTSSTVTAVTGALTITNDKLYFLDSGIAGNADSAAAVAAALTAGATWTNTPNTVSYFLINDDNSSSIWSYVGTNTAAVAESDLTLMGTIDAKVTTGDLLFL